MAIFSLSIKKVVKSLLISSAIGILSSSAYAGVIYIDQDDEIPSQLRSEIEFELQRSCPFQYSQMFFEVDAYDLDINGDSYRLDIRDRVIFIEMTFIKRTSADGTVSFDSDDVYFRRGECI